MSFSVDPSCPANQPGTTTDTKQEVSRQRGDLVETYAQKKHQWKRIRSKNRTQSWKLTRKQNRGYTWQQSLIQYTRLPILPPSSIVAKTVDHRDRMLANFVSAATQSCLGKVTVGTRTMWVSWSSTSEVQKTWVPGTRRAGSESGWPGGLRIPRPIWMDAIEKRICWSRATGVTSHWSYRN